MSIYYNSLKNYHQIDNIKCMHKPIQQKLSRQNFHPSSTPQIDSHPSLSITIHPSPQKKSRLPDRLRSLWVLLQHHLGGCRRAQVWHPAHLGVATKCSSKKVWAALKIARGGWWNWFEDGKCSKNIGLVLVSSDSYHLKGWKGWWVYVDGVGQWQVTLLQLHGDWNSNRSPGAPCDNPPRSPILCGENLMW